MPAYNSGAGRGWGMQSISMGYSGACSGVKQLHTLRGMLLFPRNTSKGGWRTETRIQCQLFSSSALISQITSLALKKAKCYLQGLRSQETPLWDVRASLTHKVGCSALELTPDPFSLTHVRNQMTQHVVAAAAAGELLCSHPSSPKLLQRMPLLGLLRTSSLGSRSISHGSIPSARRAPSVSC